MSLRMLANGARTMSLTFLRLEKRWLEFAIPYGWAPGVSGKLDAVLVAIEALSGERAETRRRHEL